MSEEPSYDFMKERSVTNNILKEWSGDNGLGTSVVGMIGPFLIAEAGPLREAP
jgi:hypothetical protein